MNARVSLVIIILAVLSGCTFKKGDLYTSRLSGDSLTYVLMAKGSGGKLAERASNLKVFHESRGNICNVVYGSDSASLISQKSILLFNSSVPDMEADILEKGFFGSFTSRQHVVCLLVSQQDFIQHFRKTKE